MWYIRAGEGDPGLDKRFAGLVRQVFATLCASRTASLRLCSVDLGFFDPFDHRGERRPFGGAVAWRRRYVDRP